MTSEDEYELNFLKIDYNNEVKLTGAEDLELEMIDLMVSQSQFEKESIDGILLKFFKKLIPTVQDLVKTNIEQGKQFLKSHSDKKGINISEVVNRILSIDYREKFIFNRTNLQDVCFILSFSFNDIKRHKISTFAELQKALKKLNFKKYNINKSYLNNDYLKSKDNLNRSNTFKTISSTSFTTSRETNDEASEFDDGVPKCIDRTHNIPIGITYIDNNIMNSSTITSDYDYNEEKSSKKTLTKECFSFQKNNKENSELPMELIILLYKLKKVNTLIYQINDIDEEFLKMAIFIFLNIKWLFIHEIEEIKFDLGNEELQKGINNVFNQRASELYNSFHKTKYSLYYNRNYKARTINCWVPENDIFYLNSEENQNNKNYIYNNQPNKEDCNFDNHLCNIYNEYGNLTNFKYIRPIFFTSKNKDNLYEQNIDLTDDLDNYLNSDNYQRPERESIYLNAANNSLNSKSSGAGEQTANQNNITITSTEPATEKTTPMLLKEYVRKHIYYFQMVAIYSYFFMKEFKKIKKLSLYFNSSFSFEIQLMFRLLSNPYDRFHFLIFANSIDTLREANFSFNSLDSKSFENILGIIYKNSFLTSLKLSFFTPDINYFEHCLLNIWSSKKLSITKLLMEQNELLITCTGDKEREFDYFILHHNKFLETFAKNLRSFFNLLKTKTLSNLEELVLRFDIPLVILNSEKYITLIIKFIIDLLIMITFQDNRIHTLKLLAPELPFNSFKIPYIQQLFKEIILEGEHIDKNYEEKIKSEKKRKEKLRIKEKERELKEQREKENELKEKNARKDLLQNMFSFSKKDILKLNDEDFEIDIDENLEHFDSTKRFRSVFHKANTIKEEAETKRKETIETEKLNEQRRILNKNDSLQNIIIQLKINNLPELFNICIMNNLNGLKSINLGYLDEITFISFVKNYKLNLNKLENLTSLKISLGASVILYNNIEKYVYEYINADSPKLEEKYLFSDLKIISETKMNELVQLVYFTAKVPKLVFQIAYDNENIHLLSKVIKNRINEAKNEIRSIIMIMEIPKYNKIYTQNIIKCISSFYSRKENRAILCKENPNN